MYFNFIWDWCNWFGVFCFYLWLMWFCTKWSSILVVPVKDKRLLCEFFIDTSFWCLLKVSLLFLLACQWWLFEEWSKSVWWCLCIQCLLRKTQKPNLFRIVFRDQTAISVIPLFEHMLRTVCLYSSMWVQLIWVGYDKMLDYVLSLKDICVTPNVYQYLCTVIWAFLLLTFIIKLWGYYN